VTVNDRHPQFSIAILFRIQERVTALFDVLDRERATATVLSASRDFPPDSDASEFWEHCEQSLKSFRVQLLYEKYDKVVCDSVWTTLRDNAGQLPFYKDEVFQDLHSACWSKIIENIDAYAEGCITGWIWKVSQNTVFDWKRREARRWGIRPIEQLHEAIAYPKRPRSSKLVTPSRVGIRLRRAALCPGCGDLEPRTIISSTKELLSLDCGHNRPRGL
jgi:hypothetical protein